MNIQSKKEHTKQNYMKYVQGVSANSTHGNTRKTAKELPITVFQTTNKHLLHIREEETSQYLKVK